MPVQGPRYGRRYVMSEDVILSKIFPIHEIFFSDETKHDGIFVRESYDAPAVITGWRTYELTNRWEGNLPMRWRSSVVTL
jgi:hypothetical protein